MNIKRRCLPSVDYHHRNASWLIGLEGRAILCQADPGSLILNKMSSRIVDGSSSKTSLPQGSTGIHKHEKQRSHFDLKLDAIPGILLILAELILLYKTRWKPAFDVSFNMNMIRFIDQLLAYALSV